MTSTIECFTRAIYNMGINIEARRISRISSSDKTQKFSSQIMILHKSNSMAS